MFLHATPDELRSHTPQFTVLNVPEFHAVPQVDGTHSDVFIIRNFARRLTLIGSTAYAGEIKKSIDLAERFITNFAQFAATVTPEVREAGPHPVLVA